MRLMDREVLDRWCERGILALVLAILVFGPLALGAVRAPHFLVIQGLTVGVLALWTARFWFSDRPKLLWTPVCWAVAAFTLYAIARYCAADVEYIARMELIRVLIYAVIFFAILNNLHRQESMQIIALTLVFLAMGIAVYACYQFLTGSNRVWGILNTYPRRASGTYYSPNHLGGFLEMLLPLALACTLTARFKAVTKVFLGYATLVILAGLVVTVSRGAWLSTALSLLILFGALLFQRRYRLASLLVLTVLIAGGFWAAPKALVFQSRLNNALPEAGSNNENSRPSIWRAAARMWRDHPWWGVGPAHFDVRFRGYRPPEVDTNPQWAHNDYLNALADWGLVGAGLIAAAWILLAAGVARSWSSIRLSQADLGGRSGSNRFAFILGASAGLLAILCHSFLDFNFQIPANAILAVALMALLSSHLRFATDRCWVLIPVWGRVLASLLLGAGAAYLGVQGWRGATEHYWLARAARAPQYSPETIENLKRAFASNPGNGQTAYAIGEAYQIRSREGGELYPDFGGADYRQLAQLGMDWLARSQRLNPWHAYSYMRSGMCLDWLNRHDDADACFNRAEELDPNGYYTLNQVGLHYIERENYAAARVCFERSLNLEGRENLTPKIFLELAQRRLMEAAANTNSLSPDFLRQ
jgi:O-antigen ligase